MTPGRCLRIGQSATPLPVFCSDVSDLIPAAAECRRAAPAAVRSEPDEARVSSAPERTRSYVRTRDERERSQATLIDAALSRPLRNAVLPHLRVQSGTAKAEQRGRGLLVPARALECLE